MDKNIRIGTRGSDLARYQANSVKKILEASDSSLRVDICIIKTSGDKILDTALSKIGGKGLFTREIEVALHNNEIDIAVHSLKDLPTILPPELALGGVLARDEVRDVLISKDGRKAAELGENDVLGTSSLRRKAQWLNYNNKSTVCDIRGNVGTRIKKMQDGYCDALILAGAGIERLGMQASITEYLDPAIMLPAVGQGIVGIEVRDSDTTTREIIASITDQETMLCAEAERAFLHYLQGGCQVPVGCLCRFEKETFVFTGMIADCEGKKVIRQTCEGSRDQAVSLICALAQKLLDEGGREILENIRKGL